MKKTAKFFSLLLALIIAMSAFSISGFAVATELEAGNSKETAANIPEFGVEYVSELKTPSEWNWFKFTTKQERAFYYVSFKLYSLPAGTGMNFGPCVFLYDENLQEIYSDYNDRVFNYQLLENSTYYIVIRNGKHNSATGTYELKVTYKLDEAGSSSESAKMINVNETIKSSLDGTNDTDYYSFVAPIAGEYKVAIDNISIPGNGSSEKFGFNLYMHDRYGKNLGYDYCHGDFGKAQFDAVLEEGEIYYIKFVQGIYFYDRIGDYELSVTCDIPATITSISLASAPEKTEYLVGETIDVNGLSVEAAYSDGTKKTVEGYSITGFDSSTAGTKTVTITYTENGVTCTCTFDVTVSEPAPAVELLGIAYVTLPDKTSYKVGESFNKSGLVVSAQYSDGSSKVVTDYRISGFDSSTAGTKTVTVSYTENGITKTCKFNVNVVAEKKLIAISVAAMPTKTAYQIGEDFDASGLVVNAFYDNGTSAFVTDYTVSGFDSETAGTKTVVVAYTDKDITKSCTFEVTVEEPEDSGNFFTNLINSIINFFMSIIEFFTSILGG